MNPSGGTATSSFTITPDMTAPTVTGIVSQQSGGGTGNGQLEVGDRLILTFSEDLASIPTTFTGAETRPSSGLLNLPDVQLNITGFTNGSLDTGSSSYLATGLLCILACASGTANFNGTASLSNNGPATTVTLSVSAVTGDAVAPGTGTLHFSPANTIQDRVGNGAAGTYPTTFQLF